METIEFNLFIYFIFCTRNLELVEPAAYTGKSIRIVIKVMMNPHVNE